MLAPICLALAACSPSHDWRSVRLGPADSLFPCKPVTAERTVALAGMTRSMSLSACAVDDVTYAVSWVQATSAADAAQVAQALLDTQTANWRASAASGTATVRISVSPLGSTSPTGSPSASVVQGVVIGPVQAWRQAQQAGHVGQFLTEVKLAGPRP